MNNIKRSSAALDSSIRVAAVSNAGTVDFLRLGYICYPKRSPSLPRVVSARWPLDHHGRDRLDNADRGHQDRCRRLRGDVGYHELRRRRTGRCGLRCCIEVKGAEIVSTAEESATSPTALVL